MKAHETMRYYLAADSKIVDQDFRYFEKGMIKLINKEELTISEKNTIKPFERDTIYMSFGSLSLCPPYITCYTISPLEKRNASGSFIFISCWLISHAILSIN